MRSDIMLRSVDKEKATGPFSSWSVHFITVTVIYTEYILFIGQEMDTVPVVPRKSCLALY